MSRGPVGNKSAGAIGFPVPSAERFRKQPAVNGPRSHARNLFAEVRAGVAARPDHSLGRHLKPLLLLALPLVALYIAAAIFVVPSGEAQDYNFVSEEGAITALSAVLLSSAAAFALMAWLLSVGSSLGWRSIWLLVAASMGFLAMDELLGFHEALGSVLDDIDVFGLRGSGVIRGWNDLVVVLYGIVALPVAVLAMPALARVPRFLEFGAAAFGFYVVHTAVDSVVEPPTLLSVVVEESAKLYAGLFLAMACLSAAFTSAASATNEGGSAMARTGAPGKSQTSRS